MLSITFFYTDIKQTIQGEIDTRDDVYRFSLFVPHRILPRWSKYMKVVHGARVSFHYRYSLFKVLKMANVTSDEFGKCWEFVENKDTDDGLFRLLYEAGFGPRCAAYSSKLDFVRKVLQRYKEAKVFDRFTLASMHVCVHIFFALFGYCSTHVRARSSCLSA